MSKPTYTIYVQIVENETGRRLLVPFEGRKKAFYAVGPFLREFFGRVKLGEQGKFRRSPHFPYPHRRGLGDEE